MNRIFSVILLRFWKWRVLWWNKDAMFLQVNVFLSDVCTDDLCVCISVLQSAVIGLDLIESPPLCYLHRYWSNQLSLIAATFLHLWMADYYCIFFSYFGYQFRFQFDFGYQINQISPISTNLFQWPMFQVEICNSMPKYDWNWPN